MYAVIINTLPPVAVCMLWAYMNDIHSDTGLTLVVKKKGPISLVAYKAVPLNTEELS